MIEQPLEHRAGISLYQQLVQRLTSRIRAGHLAPGVQLPSVRELAKATGVNALTVLKAYAALEQQQLIVTRWGKGSFVAATPPMPVSRDTDAHLSMLIDGFLAEALPLAASPQRLLELLNQRLHAT